MTILIASLGAVVTLISPSLLAMSRLLRTRRTLSQFWSFKIRRPTFLSYIRSADLLITRL